MDYTETLYKNEQYYARLYQQNLDNFCSRNRVAYDLVSGEFTFEFREKYYQILTKQSGLACKDPRVRVIFVDDLKQVQKVILAIKHNIEVDDNGHLIHEADEKKLIELSRPVFNSRSRRHKKHKKKSVQHTKKRY